MNEANSVLSDKQKRQNYDTFGSADAFGNGQGFDAQGWDDIDPFEFLRRNRADKPKGENITAEVDLTFREAFKGGKMKVNAVRQRACSHCHGTGSEDGLEHRCPHCNGTGRMRKTKQFGNASFISETTCPYCGGSGRLISNACTKCHGSGTELYEETIEIEVPAGVFDGASVTYRGMGEPSQYPGCEPGDLIVIFTVYPEENFRKDGNDLIYNLELTLLEAWGGCSKTVEHLDGTKINVKIPPLTKCGKRFSVKGKGFAGGINGFMRIPDGNFVIEVTYKMPEKNLTEQQKKILAEFYQ